MYKCINGWTKETMKAQVRLKNNGTVSRYGLFCLYEAPDKNHCAVGCFIPEDHMGLRCSRSVTGLLLEYKDLKEHMPLSDMNEFQNVHDTADSNENIWDILCVWIDENVSDEV